MRNILLGQPVVDHFPVYGTDGISKVTGVSGFTPLVWKDAVPQVTVVTITEIGTTGEYEVSLTPDSEGVWSCEVQIDTNGQSWYGEYAVKKSDLNFTGSMAEDGTYARFTVWGEDGVSRALWLTDMSAEIRDASGNLVTVLGAGVGPSADGTFLFNCFVSLIHYDIPYFLAIIASDGTTTWTGNCGFVRVK